MPPSFCRHNRFIQNCPICRPQEPAAAPKRPARSTSSRARSASGGATRAPRSSAVRVRQLVQAADDGYRCELVPGLKATADARRLADELAFAAARLEEFADDPPGLYADIVTIDDPEEALWLAFLVAFICPLEGGEDPFAAIRSAHVPWASGELPRLDVARGPRAELGDPASGERTVLAYRAWAGRAGSQLAALSGEAAWTPERRFDRVFERLSLPGFGRSGRYELLVSLGRLDLVEASPTTLRFADDGTTLAAKRVFGIGDTVLLERRARALADAIDLPIEALDLALSNWGARGSAERATYGSRATADEGERDAIAAVLRA